MTKQLISGMSCPIKCRLQVLVSVQHSVGSWPSCISEHIVALVQTFTRYVCIAVDNIYIIDITSGKTCLFAIDFPYVLLCINVGPPRHHVLYRLAKRQPSIYIIYVLNCIIKLWGSHCDFSIYILVLLLLKRRVTAFVGERFVAKFSYWIQTHF